jgi:hypothetical protein
MIFREQSIIRTEAVPLPEITNLYSPRWFRLARSVYRSLEDPLAFAFAVLLVLMLLLSI